MKDAGEVRDAETEVNQAKENKVYEMALRLMDHVGSEERTLRGMASD